ncbi:MAG TPA: patatin-like phospholipase family protein, partial [Pseudonocardiaceae bacterium]|nr:patatin-like phospholipase family protein [Pseudonocardiaceae bacterium]
MTISFVLAGGGSLAATQVGMLRALSEADITPDFLVGTSAG